MSTKSVLIIGGSGLIGTHLILRLRDEYKVFATYRDHPIRMRGVTAVPLHLRDPDWVKRIVYMAAPDVVVYAVAPNRTLAEDARLHEAERLFVTWLAPVLKSSTIFQPKFIFLSSSLVFDGARGNYHEQDTVLANASEGKLKVAGENVVKTRALNYCVIRLSPVYGRGNGQCGGMLDELRARLERDTKVELDSREVHSYAPVGSVADLIKQAIELAPKNHVLHFGGLTKLSLYDFAKAFAKRFGYDQGKILEKNYDGALIPQEDYSLNSTHSIEQVKAKPLSLEEGLEWIAQSTIGSKA